MTVQRVIGAIGESVRSALLEKIGPKSNWVKGQAFTEQPSVTSNGDREVDC